MKKKESVLSFFFLKAITSASQVKFFFVLVKSYSISPARHEKSFVHALFVCLFVFF